MYHFLQLTHEDLCAWAGHDILARVATFDVQGALVFHVVQALLFIFSSLDEE